MTSRNPFNLPIFDDAYDIEQKQYIRIELSPTTMLYSIYYPSGMYKHGMNNHVALTELCRYIENEERAEHVLRYATEWRRVNYYPDHDQVFPVFPNGREYRGGAGTHKSFGKDFIWQQQEEE